MKERVRWRLLDNYRKHKIKLRKNWNKFAKAILLNYYNVKNINKTVQIEDFHCETKIRFDNNKIKMGIKKKKS